MSMVMTVDGDIDPLGDILADGRPFFRKYFDYDDIHCTRIERTVALVLKNNPDPDLLRIYDVTELYYDMELLDTGARTDTMKPDILNCLGKLHKLGVVYVDLKHDNMGYSDIDKKWKLFDFNCSGVILPGVRDTWLFEPPKYKMYKSAMAILELRQGANKTTDIDYALFDMMFPPIKMKLNTPWFEHVRSGDKIYEGRRKWAKTLGIRKGDIVSISHQCDEDAGSYNIVIEDILEFETFEEALRALPMEQVLPGVCGIAEGVEIYKKYVSMETQEKEGVIIFKVKVV